jgi:hypothetical protein
MALWDVTRAIFIFVYHCKQFYCQHPSGIWPKCSIDELSTIELLHVNIPVINLWAM